MSVINVITPNINTHSKIDKLYRHAGAVSHALITYAINITSNTKSTQSKHYYFNKLMLTF